LSYPAQSIFMYLK